MYAPYGPFVGCMDGALDELNRVLRLCEKHDLKAVLDIHAMKGSQVRSGLCCSLISSILLIFFLFFPFFLCISFFFLNVINIGILSGNSFL